MLPLLALLFLVVPIVELAVVVQVAGAIGIPETILALIAISAVGAWLVKREGLSLLRRIRVELNRGEMPATEVVDGALILLAGALLLTPGFLSDILGLVLLVPPTRAGVRGVLSRRLRRRVVVYGVGDVYGRGNRRPPRQGTVLDVDGADGGPAGGASGRPPGHTELGSR